MTDTLMLLMLQLKKSYIHEKLNKLSIKNDKYIEYSSIAELRMAIQNTIRGNGIILNDKICISDVTKITHINTMSDYKAGNIPYAITVNNNRKRSYTCTTIIVVYTTMDGTLIVTNIARPIEKLSFRGDKITYLTAVIDTMGIIKELKQKFPISTLILPQGVVYPLLYAYDRLPPDVILDKLKSMICAKYFKNIKSVMRRVNKLLRDHLVPVTENYPLRIGVDYSNNQFITMRESRSSEYAWYNIILELVTDDTNKIHVTAISTFNRCDIPDRGPSRIKMLTKI